MAIPILTFFNNKGGVGKTSLVYHSSWMLAKMGYRVLVCDLDPQANLTAAFLQEEQLKDLWEIKADNDANKPGNTIMQCVNPLQRVSDVKSPVLKKILDNLQLIPGDLALAGFEDTLSESWPSTLGSDELYRPFRVLTAFFTVMQTGAQKMRADIILVDVGPNLGAINRSALIASDYLVVPLAADLFSLQGLRNLGPILRKWRDDWEQRKNHWEKPEFPIPKGTMKPIGYVVQQHSVRLSRPVKAYDQWVKRMPEEYARQMLGTGKPPYPPTPEDDTENALATIKHYRSLVPHAQKARKPIFELTNADGAIGSHALAVQDAGNDFRELSNKILEKIPDLPKL